MSIDDIIELGTVVVHKAAEVVYVAAPFDQVWGPGLFEGPFDA